MKESINEKRAEGYIEEAQFSLESAQAIFDEAQRTGKQLWAQAVKTAYDSMEQAVSAALAKEAIVIPKQHPAKITKFVNSCSASDKLKEALFFWLRKRAKSQYVDVIEDEVSVPHKQFNEEDAEHAITDCKFVIETVKKLLKTGDEKANSNIKK